MSKISSRILKPAALALIQRDVDIKNLQHKLQLPISLTDSNQEITQKQAVQFLEYYISCFDSSDTSASIAFIEHLNLSIFGPVGFAMMSAPTLSHTLTAMLRYKRAIGLDLLPDFRVESDHQQAVLHWMMWDHSKPLQEFVMELSIGFLNLVRMQLPQGQWLSVVKLLQVAHWPKPDFISWTKHHMPGVTIKYNQQNNLLACKPQVMKLQPLAGNNATFALLCQQLEVLTQQALLQNRGTVDELKTILQRGADKNIFLDLAQAAGKMHMSVRTLTRKLDDESSSFKMVNNVVRADIACKLLRADELPLKTIAHKSGFLSEAGFSRAFKTWFKVPPMVYRKNHNLEVEKLTLTKAII